MRKKLVFFDKAKDNFRYNYLPKIVDWLVHLSNIEPRKLIAQSNASSILIDNSVIGYGVTHETGWVSKGDVLWGDSIPVDTGYAARVPVYSDDDKKNIARSVKFLPSIVNLAKSETITLFRSFDLTDEMITQPIGRYSGYGLFDLSLFSAVNLPVLPDESHELLFKSSNFDGPTVKEQVAKRREKILTDDDRSKELVGVLGKKNSQDAIHIATAEKTGCYCFLTMDFRLIDAIKSQAGHPAIKALKTKILSPEEFAKTFRIRPIPTRLFSFHNASFPVAHTENWEDSMRQTRKKH